MRLEAVGLDFCPSPTHDDATVHLLMSVAAEVVAKKRQHARFLRREAHARDLTGRQVEAQLEIGDVKAVKEVDRHDLENDRYSRLDLDVIGRVHETSRGHLDDLRFFFFSRKSRDRPRPESRAGDQCGKQVQPLPLRSHAQAFVTGSSVSA